MLVVELVVSGSTASNRYNYTRTLAPNIKALMWTLIKNVFLSSDGRYECKRLGLYG